MNLHLVDTKRRIIVKQVNGEFYALADDGNWYLCRHMEVPSENPDKEFTVRFTVDKSKKLEE